MRQNKYGFQPPITVQDPRPGLCYPIDGASYVSPRGDLAYVPVPKCASLRMRWWCEANGWHKENYHDQIVPAHRRFLVLLRDPRERWVSAMKQWINHEGYDWSQLNQQSRDIIRRHIICDEHTMPQHRFLVGLRLAQIDAVDVSHDRRHTSDRIQEIMARHGHHCRLDPNEDRERNPDIAELWQWVDDIEVAGRLQNAYADDYWLRYFLLDSELPDELRLAREPMPGDR